MMASVLTGLLAAVCVASFQLLPYWAGNGAGFLWSSPLALLLITCLTVVFQRFVLDRRPGVRAYDGVVDLLIHIHSPSIPDSPLRWAVRGAVSYLLSFFGGWIGPEGAAVELTHALEMKTRPRSARWFEQRRRTDVATSLAAGIAAAFSAPFAGVLLPLELGVGGRTLSAVLGALSAFVGLQVLARFFPGIAFLSLGGAVSGFSFLRGVEWVGVAGVGVVAGVFAWILVRFIRYSQESLLDLFQTQSWMRTLAGGALLFLVALVYRQGHLLPRVVLEDTLWARHGIAHVELLLSVQVLCLALVLSAFGSVGIFWPLFAIGGSLGFVFHHLAFPELPGFTAALGLAGGAAMWGSVLGAPLSGTVLAFEITQNYAVIVPCFLAAMIAREVRKALGGKTLMELDLEARGMALTEGRSAALLDAVYVRDAMVADPETVHEHEPVFELHQRLLKSKYPFLPVVNAQGVYQGLITIDRVQEAWQLHGHCDAALSRVIEAKDLLYKRGVRTPTVKINDRLSVTSGMFDDGPCVPVLGEDRRVLGLLFVYNVRLAYDREVARRSMSFENREA